MLEKKIDYSGAVFWLDPQTKEKYGAAAGALGWPGGGHDGFLVVGASSWIEDTDAEAFPLTVFAEGTAGDVDALFRLALKMGGEFAISRWIADMSNTAMEALRHQFNTDRLRRGLGRISLVGPIENEELPFYVNLLKKLTRPGRKILSFGAGSALPGCLLSLTPEQASKGKLADHPPLAALGLAVSALGKWRGRAESEAVRVQMDFDAHDPFPPDRRPRVEMDDSYHFQDD